MLYYISLYEGWLKSAKLWYFFLEYRPIAEASAIPWLVPKDLDIGSSGPGSQAKSSQLSLNFSSSHLARISLAEFASKLIVI